MIRQVWILIAKKLNGEASSEELQELDQLLREDDSYNLLEELDFLKKKPAQLDPDSDAEFEGKWQRLNSLIDDFEAENEKQPGREFAPTRVSVVKPLYKYVAYAASITLFASLTLVAVRYINKPSNGATTVTAPTNGVSKISLPDGSSVWLNSSSKLSYRNNPENNCREVKLTGEAYFDVVKDPEHPFTVEVPGFKIKVLGTAFNVRSYASDQTSQATLVRGRIELTLPNRPDQKYILRPSERFSISNPVKAAQTLVANQNPVGELTNVGKHKIEGLPDEVLWTKSEIEFDNTVFEDIAEMIAHKYNVTVTFKSGDIKQLKFTGKFRNESLVDAMSDLQRTANFYYKIHENEILIDDNPIN